MKVVIIGAGPAGLSTAYKLLKSKKKIDVTIIEEDSIPGGISKTIKYNGNRMDLGGHRFFTKNKEVEDFFFEILKGQGYPAYDDKILGTKKNYFKNGLDPEKYDNVMLIRNRVSRIYYNKKFFDYPVNLNFKTIRNMGPITTINSGFSYIKASIFKLKEINLENFYINRFGYKLYSMFFKNYTEKLWGRAPSDIDASWGSQRVKGISIRAVIKDYFSRLFKLKNKNKETSLIEAFYYPKYGPGEFYEEIASKIIDMGGHIIYDSKVVKINNSSDTIMSVTYLKDNKRHEELCDYLVSSMPMKDLVNSMNNIPKNIKNISNNLPYRDFITVGVLLDKIDLKPNRNIKTIHGSISDNWIYIQEPDVKVGRVQTFNNWSPYMVKDSINTIFIGMEYFASVGDSLWILSDNEMKKFAFSELKKIGFTKSDKALDSVVVHVKKAYPAYFDSYKDIGELREYLGNYNNLYCIGRNGTHSYNNMDHSILSGFICSEMVLNKDHDLNKLWNVNVDKSYQEEK